MFAKNLVVKMHVYLLIFFVSFAQPVAYASAAPVLDFVEIRNFVRTAGAASADYLFKKSANDPTFNGAANDSHYKTPKHSVTNAKLGSVAFKRILGLTGYGLAAFAVYEIVSELQKDGWTVDAATQEIYKLDGGLKFYIDTNGFNKTYFPSAESAIQNFLDAKKQPDRPAPTFTGYNSDFPKALSDMRAGETIFRTFGTSLGPYILSVDKNSESKQVATDADVAAVLPRVSDEQIAALMVSPDYLAEGHAPTADAAAAAAPSSQPLPQETSTLGTVKTETQTTTNPDGSTTKTTTTTTTNPDGTTSTQTSTTTTKPDGSTTTTSSGTKPADMPAFCNYAKTLCDWILWTKQEPQLTPVPEIPKREISRDELPQAQQINFGGGCPSGETFQAFGQTVTLSYGVACDLMTMIKPFVILAGNVTALFIFINSIRN